jgi:hypothetical protein
MPLFQRRRRRGPPGDGPPRLGLVVPVRAIQIFDPKTGKLIYDELPILEKEYRMNGRPEITFEEDPDDYNPDTDVTWQK